MEENTIFPGLEKVLGKKGVLEGNLNQHHAFEGKLKEVVKYSGDTSVEKYDANALKKLMDGVAEELHKHLKEEIESLLSLREYGDGEGLLQVWKKGENEASRQDKVCNVSFPYDALKFSVEMV